MTPGFDMSGLQFLDKGMTMFRMNDPAATNLILRAFIANPELDLSYNAYDQHFVIEEY